MNPQVPYPTLAVHLAEARPGYTIVNSPEHFIAYVRRHLTKL